MLRPDYDLYGYGKMADLTVLCSTLIDKLKQIKSRKLAVQFSV